MQTESVKIISLNPQKPADISSTGFFTIRLFYIHHIFEIRNIRSFAYSLKKNAQAKLENLVFISRRGR
jgi:hypothetical protein